MRGDFGESFRHQQPAFGLVLERLPATLELAFAALLLAVVVALPLGIVAALYRGRAADMLAMGFAVVGQATPYFWMGIMLILVVSVELGWLPTSGRGGWPHLILPAVTLGTHFAAVARAAHAHEHAGGARPELRDDGARQGARRARAWCSAHALKNAAVPVVTLIGLQFGTLLGGAVVTETIFAWPGVGRLAVQSIFVRDYPVVQAGVLVLALVVRGASTCSSTCSTARSTRASAMSEAARGRGAAPRRAPAAFRGRCVLRRGAGGARRSSPRWLAPWVAPPRPRRATWPRASSRRRGRRRRWPGGCSAPTCSGATC